MKRDLKLVRLILLDVEATPPGQVIDGFTQEGYDERTIAEHVRLLIDANFLEGQVVQQFGTSAHEYAVTGLTWQGHEFLANAKNDTVWKKVVAEAESKGASISMTVLNGLLMKAAQKYAGLE
jgi:hypothetical protein